MPCVCEDLAEGEKVLSQPRKFKNSEKQAPIDAQ